MQLLTHHQNSHPKQANNDPVHDALTPQASATLTPQNTPPPPPLNSPQYPPPPYDYPCMADNPQRTARAVWTLAIATLVLLFAGEIAQMWLAQRDRVNGLPTTQAERRRQDDWQNFDRATTAATTTQ